MTRLNCVFNNALNVYEIYSDDGKVLAFLGNGVLGHKIVKDINSGGLYSL